MGRDRSETKHGPDRRRVTVAEAAEILGITAEAVRTRIKRDKLDSVKEPDRPGGKVYVLLEADQTGPNVDPTPQGQDQTLGQTQLVETLREHVAYLQGVIATRDRELEQRSEEIRRRDAALEREQQLTAMFADRLRAIEAPQDSPEDSETVEEAPEEAEPRSAEGEARDELGAERARRQAEEERVADLEADVADLEAELEDFGGGRESSPTVEEASDAEFRSAAGGVSRREARRRSWWRTRIGSIIGGCLVFAFLALVGFLVTMLILR